MLAAPAEIAAIVGGSHGDPFAVLGPHRLADKRVVVRTIQPRAAKVAVLDAGGRELAKLERLDASGFFAGAVPGLEPFHAYRLKLSGDGSDRIVDDPYRLSPVLGELDIHLLAEGTHLENYRRLGAHPRTLDGLDGTAFAVWAPNARRVSVVGDFNDWDGRVHPMRLRHGSGVWEIFLPGIGAGRPYKYEILGADGALQPLKADPYAFAAEHPPKTASVVSGLARHDWQDADWLARRQEGDPRRKPIAVYEVHLGSWARVPEEGGRSLTYDELADRLIPYAADLGFSHLELMPISEYPFEGSWGYQPIGLYAPTSRFGPPEGLQRFIDRAHAAGLGVLLDWVPGHFPTDAHGLGRFDGTHLYEHADPRLGFHPDWGTLVYNYGRNEVRNYLLGNALYWLDQFHVDGLRVDAVASMLYLDYSRKEGQWLPNRHGGRENLEAISFLQRANELVYGRQPGAITVAEESTAWPGVSRPAYLGGLGFGFKWNMGWMHDTLHYIANDPVHRRFHHNNLTFGLLYAFAENFMLPISHDEVVHGKGSLIGKMPGDAWQKFANLRAYLSFMWTHPGKKLLFMGCEIGQWREWNHDFSLDWHLLDQPLHKGVQNLVRDLNRLYRAVPALHQRDCTSDGFAWIEGGDSENSVLSYLRYGDDGAPVAVICNFTPVVREGYRIGVPTGGRWAELHNSDSAVYGGSGIGNGGAVEAQSLPSHGRPFSLNLTLPPLGALVLQPMA